MLQIIVTVPLARDRASGLRIVDGMRTLYEDWAVATADPAASKRAKNTKADPLRPGGHPPLGRYELTARGSPPQSAETEYGHVLLLFEPTSGQALDAESYGRLALLVYAGRMAPDSKLRRTQGGLRLSATALDILLQHVDDTTPVELRIETMEDPPWWAFWRKPQAPPAYSERPPQFDAPPLDEATLMAELMKHSQRRMRRVERDDDDEWDRRRERDTSRDARSSSSDSNEVRGRAGEGGGAGASGGWSDAPATGRGPGVDAAGRIITAAGVAAVATAAAMAAREHGSDRAETSGSWETASRSQDDAPSSATSGASSSDDGSGGSWNSSTTSY